jgi:hypothetical protein
MQRDQPPRIEPDGAEGYPGTAMWLLAGMAMLFIVAAYLFVSDRLDPPGSRLESAQTQPRN